MVKVQVYFNLRKRSYSLRDPRAGRLINTDQIVLDLILSDVQFTVRQSGRRRAIKDGYKNVHAFSVGTIVQAGTVDTSEATVPISYSPFRRPPEAEDFFFRKDTGECVFTARLVVLSTKEVEGTKLVRVPVVLAAL